MPEPIFIEFLGTGGSTPFSGMNMPCITLKYERDLLIFDIGEGSQFSLLSNGLHPVRSSLTILITHFHADHTAGLPGLLHTLKLAEKQDPISIIGPEGTRTFFKEISTAFLLDQFPFDVKIIEVKDPKKEPKLLERKRFSLYAFPTRHTHNSIGYAFREKEVPGKFKEEKAKKLGIPPTQIRGKLKEGKTVKLPNGRTVKPEEVLTSPQKGRKIVYTGDTRPTRTTIRNSKMADLLIHDGTFSHKEVERAKKRYNSTIKESVLLARKAKVKSLALVHSSSRYKGKKHLLREEAKQYSSNSFPTFVPDDGDKLRIELDKIKST